MLRRGRRVYSDVSRLFSVAIGCVESKGTKACTREHGSSLGWLLNKEVGSMVSGRRCYRRVMGSTRMPEKDELEDSMCWRCGKTPEDIFLCGACGTIQPPCDSVDAYAVFGLDEASFDVDLDRLEATYKGLQKYLHPDKFSSATTEEQEISSEQAMRVNHAYATLKNPLSRATYLLSLHGCSASHDGEKETIRDFDMLQAIMEFREEVEYATDEAALLELKRKVDGQIDACLQQLKRFFGEKDFDKALKETQTLRYLNRMHEAVEEKL